MGADRAAAFRTTRRRPRDPRTAALCRCHRPAARGGPRDAGGMAHRRRATQATEPPPHRHRDAGCAARTTSIRPGRQRLDRGDSRCPAWFASRRSAWRWRRCWWSAGARPRGSRASSPGVGRHAGSSQASGSTQPGQRPGPHSPRPSRPSGRQLSPSIRSASVRHRRYARMPRCPRNRSRPGNPKTSSRFPCRPRLRAGASAVRTAAVETATDVEEASGAAVRQTCPAGRRRSRTDRRASRTGTTVGRTGTTAARTGTERERRSAEREQRRLEREREQR